MLRGPFVFSRPLEGRAFAPCLCGSLSAGLAPGPFALVGESSGFRNNHFCLVFAPSLLFPRYWANLKLWFKQKISKEEFDLEARRLLTQDNGKKPSCVCSPAGSNAALPLPGLGGAPPCCTVLPEQGNGCEGNKNGKDSGSNRIKKVGGALACRGK